MDGISTDMFKYANVLTIYAVVVTSTCHLYKCLFVCRTKCYIVTYGVLITLESFQNRALPYHNMFAVQHEFVWGVEGVFYPRCYMHRNGFQ